MMLMNECTAAESAELFFSHYFLPWIKSNTCKRIGVLAAIGAFLFPSICALAQTDTYADYPQTRGKVQGFTLDDIPSWMSLDMQIRLRTELQAGYEYTSGNDRIYELTRLFGGMTVRPTSNLIGYMQFIDTHALGLPLHEVASNMRDNFDLRQG